ncbi:MAG: hypothetical protein KF791_15015 [Verrucomicrobiae bacterium]|nr:hypothetical protein [Verrucomicrobiae bacterium]
MPLPEPLIAVPPMPGRRGSGLRAVASVLVMLVGPALIWIRMGPEPAGRVQVVATMLWWVAGAAVVAFGMRRIPLQNLLSAAGIAAALGIVASQWVTGPSAFPVQAGGQCVTLALGGRLAARWLLRPQAHHSLFGIRVLLTSLGLALVAMMAAGVGRPAMLLSWTLVLAATHVVTTPWLVDKRSVVPSGDPEPLWILGLTAVALRVVSVV